MHLLNKHYKNKCGIFYSIDDSAKATELLRSNRSHRVKYAASATEANNMWLLFSYRRLFVLEEIMAFDATEVEIKLRRDED